MFAEGELLRRADALAGWSIAELAARLQIPLPERPERAKGFVGRLLEEALGATAGSRPEADFPALGVELKTIPLDSQGKARESTFVTYASVDELCGSDWESSRVRHKLARVLWIPIEARPGLTFSERRIGIPLLWSPNAAQEELLRADWERLSEALIAGEAGDVRGNVGQVLQLRPKAARAEVRSLQWDAEGFASLAQPKAFYLRAPFTTSIFAAANPIGGQ